MEPLILTGLVGVVIKVTSASHVEVRGGRNVTLVIDAVDPTPETPFVTAYGSPGLKIVDSRIQGGGIFASDSPRITVLNSEISLGKNLREGVRLEGCSGFVIQNNRITGVYGESDDLIEIGPSKSTPERTWHPYAWPNMNAWRFTPFNASWKPTFLASKTFVGGEHAGKTVSYAHDDYNWTVGGVISGNTLEGSRKAGAFVYRSKWVRVYGNLVRNVRDYSIGVEWAYGCHVYGNTAVQDPEYRNQGTGGGIASMFYGENHTIEGNVLEGCRMLVVSNGQPQRNVHIKGNRVAGKLHCYFGPAPWVEGLLIQNNTVTGMIEVSASPFYTNVDIVGNRADWIRVESVRGLIQGNQVSGIIQDFNRGDRMTSEVTVVGNTRDGQEVKLTVDQPNKRPTPEPEVPVPVE